MTLSLIECTACDQTNAVDRRYCSACGTSLRHTCLQCSTECGAHETYCGNCGENLHALLDKRLTDFQNAIDRARSLRAEGKYLEAVQSLASLRAVDASIPKRLVEEARALKQEISTEHEQLKMASEQAAKEAESLYRANRYKDALERLRSIPAAYLSHESRQFMKFALSHCKETEELRAQIAADLDARRFSDLGLKIDRYLALEPENREIRELGRKVGAYACKRAQSAIATGDFQRAQQILGTIPISIRTAEIQKLDRFAMGVNRLCAEVKLAPIVDVPLISLTERLAAMAPNLEFVTKALGLMKQKYREGTKDRRFPTVPWAAIPQKTHVGLPVERPGGFRRIRLASPELTSKVAKTPGVFFTACGLALQGLSKASLSINLALENSNGLLSRISLFKTKRTAESAWGIDIGNAALKVAKLALDRTSGEVVLAECDLFPFARNLSHPEGETRRSEMVTSALNAFVEKYRPAAGEILSGNSPSLKTLVRVFNVPDAHQTKLDEVVHYEVTRQIPFPIDQVTWSYGVLGSSAEVESTLRRAVVAAIRTQDLVTRLKDYQSAGLRIQYLQPDCLALHNFLTFDEFDFGSATTSDVFNGFDRAVALLDVGSDACNLVISSLDQVWFRVFGSGGNEINQALARELKITFDAAEDLKRNPGKAPDILAALNALEVPVTRITNEVQRTLDLFAKENPSTRIERLWICGGGASQFGLLRSMRSGGLNGAAP